MSRLAEPALDEAAATEERAAALPKSAARPAGPAERRPTRIGRRGALAMLGPAFVAAVAYVDPGNFATNSRRAPGSATACSGSCWWRT